MFATSFFAAIVLGQSWSPPKTKLPREFVDSIQFVIRHGFANPHGGVYSSAEVRLPDSWGSAKPAVVYGWVFPKKTGQPQEIVAFNGLRYPIEKLIGSAQPNLKHVPKTLNGYFKSPYSGNEYSASACFLLAGNVDLAEKAYPVNEPNQLPHPFMGVADPYLVSRFWRTVDAHVNGNPLAALNDALSLQRDQDAYRNEAARLVGNDYLASLSLQNDAKDGKTRLFSYLTPVERIVTDSHRRLNLTKAPKQIGDIQKLEGEARITALIEMLDQVAARQWSQPGGVDLTSDPIIGALLEVGAPAVPAILDAIEKDTRLTRSVGFGRDFFPVRHIFSVRDAAYAAFRAIAGTDEILDRDKPFDVAKLRKYWSENGQLSFAERFYETLQDDNAGWRRWIEAAESIVMKGNVRRGNAIRLHPNPGTQLLAGESLRSKKNPSVTDLFTKRAFGLLAKEPQTFEIYHALLLAKLHFEWDRKAALPLLQDVSRQSMALFLTENGYNHVSFSVNVLTDNLRLRQRLNDPTVIQDYATWLKQFRTRQHRGYDHDRVLAFLVENQAHPLLQELPSILFESPDSGWNLEMWATENPIANNLENLAISPLITLPAFQRGLIKVLKNKTVAGTAWVEVGSEMYRDLEGSGSNDQLSQAELKDPFLPPAKEKRSFRICDHLARRLSLLEGAPPFLRTWPTSKKDEAIQELIRFLNSNSQNMDKLLKWPYTWKNNL